MHFRILSLDAGGIRGLVAARMLTTIEIAYFALLKAIIRRIIPLKKAQN